MADSNIYSGARTTARETPSSGLPFSMASGTPEMAVADTVQKGVANILESAMNLYVYDQQKKEAQKQNATTAQQYKTEKASSDAQQKWMNNFAKDNNTWNRYQTNIGNIRNWAADIQNLVNSDQNLKSSLTNIWQKSRSF
jgi:hypothetical protein